MNYFILSLNVMSPIITMIAIGYFLKNKEIINEEFVSKSSAVVFKLALPVTLFYNTANSNITQDLDGNTLSFLIYTCSVLFFVFIIGCIIAKNSSWDKKTKGAFVQGAFRSNYVIIGYPIIISLCGQGAILQMTLLAICIIPLYNILAVIILTIYNPDQKKLDVKNIFLNIIKNPLIIGILLGFVASLANLKIPSFLNNTFITIKGLTTPLALINIGSMFCFKINLDQRKPLFLAVFIKTVLTPIIFTSLAVFLGFRDYTLAIIFIIFAAPTAASSFIMAKVMNSNEKIASSMVVISTTLSSLTIFIGIIILKTYGMI